ncbi:hypothetical protein M0802_013240 [Mischocyttarus mexicanus]|nr:hypothetical protein M0802_013240 [Mischocyttarus mexicanus]
MNYGRRDLKTRPHSYGTRDIDPQATVNAIAPKLRDRFKSSVYSCADKTKEEKQPCIHAYEFLICVTNNDPKTLSLFGIFDKPHTSN